MTLATWLPIIKEIVPRAVKYIAGTYCFEGFSIGISVGMRSLGYKHPLMSAHPPQLGYSEPRLSAPPRPRGKVTSLNHSTGSRVDLRPVLWSCGNAFEAALSSDVYHLQILLGCRSDALNWPQVGLLLEEVLRSPRAWSYLLWQGVVYTPTLQTCSSDRSVQMAQQ